jgi:Spy/CpxP family protein refolding chaperone
MRTFGKTILALGALCFLASQAHAQQGRGFGMGGGMQLYMNSSVQKEIKLTDDQVSKVREIVTDIRGKYQDKLQEARDAQDREKMMKLNQEMTAEARKAMSEVLKPEQQKRFTEIQMQQMGAMAFSNPEVQKKIVLTDDQKDKLKTINDDAMAQRREIMQGFQDDREGTMKKMAEFNKEIMGKVTALLSEDQRKTWKEMTGEPFEVKFEPPRNN